MVNFVNELNVAPINKPGSFSEAKEKELIKYINIVIMSGLASVSLPYTQRDRDWTSSNQIHNKRFILCNNDHESMCLCSHNSIYLVVYWNLKKVKVIFGSLMILLLYTAGIWRHPVGSSFGKLNNNDSSFSHRWNSSMDIRLFYLSVTWQDTTCSPYVL